MRRLFWVAAAAVATVTIATIVLYGVRSRTERWILHGRDVGRLAREAIALAADRETGIRGYMLTHDTVSLQPERAARVRLPVVLDSLVALTSDNESQLARARVFRQAVAEWGREFAEPILAGVAAGSSPQRVSLHDTNLAGKTSFDVIRARAERFLHAEDALYAERVGREHAADTLTLLLILASTAALSLVLRWMHTRVREQAMALLDQQAQLEEQAIGLEETMAELEATNEELQEGAAELEISNVKAVANADDAMEARAIAEKARLDLTSMLDRVTDAFLELDGDWRITYLNKTAARDTNTTLDAVRGRTLWDVFPAAANSEVERRYRTAMLDQVPTSFVHHYHEETSSNGRPPLDVWAEIHAYPSPNALSIVFRDVTAERAAAETVARRDLQLAEAQRIARIGSWEHDPQTGIGTWSEEMFRVMGIDSSVTPSFDAFLACIGEVDRPRLAAAVDRAQAGGEAFSIECSVSCPSDSVRRIHARGDVLRDESGRTMSVVGTVQDVTERRRLEAQLQQAQKMEAVGQLAGGVAHDFNNILTAIKSFSEILTQDLPKGSPLLSDVAEISAAADRATTLTRQLLAFSRQQVLQPAVLDLNLVVDGVMKLLMRLIGVEIRCETILEAQSCHVLADPGQLEQVLVNLAVNARDAMEGGGTLTIETEKIELDAKHAFRIGGLEDAQPGEYVVLAVSDTGHGMDAATRARIFDPFFTTKEPGKGTGLGLSTVYGIVRQSGGHVTVYSEIGRGTTFRIYLPCVKDELARVTTKVAARTDEQRSGTIMIVDDDNAVRAVVVRVLARAGYHVIEASGPTEAIALWTEYEGSIDLLMTDLMMPDMNGGALAERLLQTRQGTPVMYMSGFTSETVIRRGLVASEVTFLPKPFTITALLDAVGHALAR